MAISSDDIFNGLDDSQLLRVFSQFPTIEKVTMPARRPLNDRSARQPVTPPPPPEPPKSFRLRGIDPSPEVIGTISKHLLPITAEEILYGRLGESTVLPGLMVGCGMFLVGTAVGSVSSMIFRGSEPFTVGRALKAGLVTGFRYGVEFGVTQIIETQIGCARGRECLFDKIIAGATAGAICGAPWGVKSAVWGAARGAGEGLLMGVYRLDFASNFLG